MKKLSTSIFLLLCLLVLALVGWYWWKSAAERSDASRPVVNRKLVVADDGAAARGSPGDARPSAATNRIEALPDEVVLDVESLNLDNDEPEEQIITVRKTGAGAGALSIVIADSLPNRRGWFRSWEGALPVTKLTTLQIQARDVIGDHWLSIVVTGMNEKNEQTLTIFRERRGSEATGLQYDRIASVDGDSLRIEDADRPESYQLGQTEGAPASILAFVKDPASPNPLDQLRTTWTWNPRARAFEVSARDSIPGAQVERNIALKVLTGREADFENYLQGIWYDAQYGPGDPRTRLLVFDRQDDSIVFYSGDSQEVFQWKESHSTRTGLYVGAQNESVSTLRRLMDIEMTGADSVSVRVFEDLLMKIDSENRWDGNYRRLRDETPLPATASSPLALEGAWSGDSARLVLGHGSYSLSQGSSLSKGRWLQYAVGSDRVIELIDETAGAKRLNFRVELQEGGGQRNLSLVPVLPTINGLERAEAPTLRLSQKYGR